MLWMWMLACGGPVEDFDTPVRPQLDQLVVTGEVRFDSDWDDRMREGHAVHHEARRPLVTIYELLKGPDSFRERSATLVPLGSGFGRIEWADALNLAHVDAVTMDAVPAEQRNEMVAALGGCATWAGAPACGLKVGETRVAIVASEDAVARARSDADVVVLVAQGAAPSSDADVTLVTRPEAPGALTLADGRLVIDNPGDLVSRKSPSGDRETSFVYRLHLSPQGVGWVEGIPVHLDKVRTRHAFLDEAYEAVDDLVERSAGTPVRNEHGRAILELTP